MNSSTDFPVNNTLKSFVNPQVNEKEENVTIILEQLNKEQKQLNKEQTGTMQHPNNLNSDNRVTPLPSDTLTIKINEAIPATFKSMESTGTGNLKEIKSVNLDSLNPNERAEELIKSVNNVFKNVPHPQIQTTVDNAGTPPTNQPITQPSTPPTNQPVTPPIVLPTNQPGAPQGVVPPSPLTLQQIEDLATKAGKSTDEASQKVLSDIMKGLGALKDNNGNPEYTKISLEANLVTDDKGRYELEPFKQENHSETFYSIKVIYTVKATPAAGGNDKELSFKRTITTNGTTPEDAIAVASQFKRTVTELAKHGAGQSHDLGNISKDFEDEAQNKTRFSFHFSHDAAGRLTHLQSVKVSRSDDTQLEHKVSNQKKFIYNLKNGENRPVDPETNERDLLPGQILFGSEEQLLVHDKRFVIKEDLYAELKTKDNREAYLKEIREEIKKREEEFANVKKNFIKEPLFRWLKANPTKEYEQLGTEVTIYQKLKTAQLVLDAELEGLSPNMQKYAKLKSELKKVKFEQEKEGKIREKDIKDIEALMKPDFSPTLTENTWIHDLAVKYSVDIENKKTEERLTLCQTAIEAKSKEIESDIEGRKKVLYQLEKQISEEQTSFNKYLYQLKKLNQELETRHEKLTGLEEAAKKIADTPSSPPDDKKNAQSFLKLFHKKEMTDLSKRIEKNTDAIENILGRIKHYGTVLPPSDSSTHILTAGEGPGVI